jgi:SAM-dependent methyltransferase
MSAPLGKVVALTALFRNWLLAFIAPRPLVGVFGLPRYFHHWRVWSRKGGAPLKFIDSYPCLGDGTALTPFDPHYFYQGAWLARRIAAVQPRTHVDVGSSVATLSMLSAITETVFIDRRPLQAELPGLRCQAGDILAMPFPDGSIASLSSLHVIEHIGLGRYGDPIDPAGSSRAAKELSRVLAPGGRLYLSTPIGRERVCFNAHRVFAPSTVLEMFGTLSLAQFSWVDDRGDLRLDDAPSEANEADYACGFFEFTKLG